MQRWLCIIRTAQAGLGSSVGLCVNWSSLSSFPKKNLPHCPKQNRGIAKEKKKWRGLQLLSGGNWFIGSILPASVLNAFRRGSLLSSSQQPPPTEETKKKSLDEKIRAKKTGKKNPRTKEKSDGSVQRGNRHTDQSHVQRETCDLVCWAWILPSRHCHHTCCGRTNRDENEAQNERSNESPDLDWRAEDGGAVF